MATLEGIFIDVEIVENTEDPDVHRIQVCNEVFCP